MGLFDSILGVVENVTTVVVAPVEIAADLAQAATKPVAEAAEQLVEDVKQLTK
jgi:hypothetical protein